jgi:threonine/homoserine/homoserine lactone efflux protein
MLAAVLAGLAAGYAIAIPVGAIAAYLITLGASHGFRVGAGGGLGAASVDGLYATIAVTIGGIVAPLIAPIQEPLRWVAALVLAAVGIKLLVDGVRSGSPGAQPADVPTARRAFVTVFGLTLVNPATVIYFAALVTGGTFDLDGAAQSAVFVVAAFIASASWQLLLAAAGSGLGRVLRSGAARRWTAIVGGVVVLALAAKTALGG